MRQTLLALAVTMSALASAQLSTLNSTRLELRYYNDMPNSVLTFGNPWPSVFIDDENVSAPSGFANRHVWTVSNDGGNTSYLFQGTDNFTLTEKVKLTVNGPQNKEAGIVFYNDLNGDHIFLVKTGNNGEVAAFAGAFPFFSFTQQYNDHYVTGSTVTMSVTYFKDTDNVNKVIYRYQDHFSGALPWANNEQALGPNTRIGGYLQVQNDPNNPNNGGRGDFNDITVSPANKVFPDNINLLLGKVTDGDKRSLYFSDGAPLRVCKFIVPSQSSYPVTFEVNGVSNYDTLSSLAFHVNSRMSVSGLFGQVIDLYDWSTGQYADSNTSSVTTAYSAHDAVATGNVGRYLGPNHELRGRVRIKQTGPASSSAWCAEVDEGNFTVAP
ncbi:MAG: hypothetical protein JSS66_17760 [Armatimonadetes bacterium]|nr:hypothetical protein [Armatimonadota bacterium]